MRICCYLMITENIFCQIFIKTYVKGADKNRLADAIIMSPHDIGVYEEISKIIPSLSSNNIKYAPYLFF